ncbi:hypothetical protein Pmani_008729 [Petrolisthes manimaculis]|uniref:Uncharacterized protein n=1 Tax=Petrolisthes manimaculis TaxID=1843537 RepID=A0AAE1Q5R4_9EUCA|nr:hypothetical protein Pmani_008729 [Petrolisthes manimaculis]
MGESVVSSNKSNVTFDESHVNIKIPNRCRRCHTYNEDPDAPSLRESFVIILRQMTHSPSNACFLACLLMPYLGITVVSLLLLLLAGYSTVAAALFHSVTLLFLAWLCVITYFGRRYAKLYSAEQDLLNLNTVI